MNFNHITIVSFPSLCQVKVSAIIRHQAMDTKAQMGDFFTV